MAEDPGLFVAIRDDYLSVYYQGQALARVFGRSDGTVAAEVHVKYLVDPTVQACAVVDEQGRIAPLDASDRFQIPVNSDIADVERLKAAAAPYSGVEKQGVHELALADPAVIDLEIALSVPGKKKRKFVARRIDLAVLVSDEVGAKIRFVEAKHFTNPELRTSGAAAPVVQQVSDYSEALVAHQKALCFSYRIVARNLLTLEGRFASLRRSKALENAAQYGVTVDPDPIIAVYGFDQDQKRGDIWTSHAAKLQGTLGKGESRIVMVGNPRGFRLTRAGR